MSDQQAKRVVLAVGFGLVTFWAFGLVLVPLRLLQRPLSQGETA